MTLSPVPIPQFFFWNCLDAMLLLLATVACLYLARHASAATRHALCLSGLLPLTILPVLTLVMPAWPVSMGTAQFLFWVSSLSTPTAPSHPAVASWSNVLALVWAVGTVCVLGRVTVGAYLVRRAWLASSPVDTAFWRDALLSSRERESLAPASFGVRSGPVTNALTFGVLRPCILLPREAHTWSAFERRAVLLHELAHISRRDCLSNYIAELARALFWFHPLAWILAGRLRREQELACDDLVLQGGVVAADYAELLLRTARHLPSPSFIGCAFAARDLRERLTHVLDARCNRNVSPRARAIHAVSFSLVLLLVPVVKPGVAAQVYASGRAISVPLSLQRAESRSSGSTSVYKIGGDVSAPVLLHKTEPDYTPSAKNKKIQGTVLLSLVIGTDGRAREIQVVRGLDPGLDANAKKAIAAWSFKPSERQGKPVNVRAQVEVNFRLK